MSELAASEPKVIRLAASSWEALPDLLGRDRQYRVVFEGHAAEIEAVDYEAIRRAAALVNATVEFDRHPVAPPSSSAAREIGAAPRAALEDLVLAGSWDVDRRGLLDECLGVLSRIPAAAEI